MWLRLKLTMTARLVLTFACSGILFRSFCFFNEERYELNSEMPLAGGVGNYN